MELVDIDLSLIPQLGWSLDSYKMDTTDYTQCMSHLQALHLTQNTDKLQYK